MRGIRRLLVSLLVPLTVAVTAVFGAPVSGSAAAAQSGVVPVVLIPGWHGDPASMAPLAAALERAGRVVLDFDPTKPGAQALSYEPDGYGPDGAGEHIPYMAGRVAQPTIDAALRRAGFGPSTHIDIVAHSMGGLVARFLIEQPGARVGRFSAARGWYGDPGAPPDIEPDWASRVDHLVTMGTPSHGTILGLVPATVGLFGRWNATGGDMEPDSPFLARMGTAAPCAPGGDGAVAVPEGPGCPVYTDIGGAPLDLPIPAEDDDGDGILHGFDGLVPSESPFLAGDTHYLVPVNHGQLPGDPRADQLALDALDRPPAGAFTGQPPVVGQVRVHLDHADIETHTGRFTGFGYRFALSFDPDGAGRFGVPAGVITDPRHGRLVASWAQNDARTSFPAVPLSGRSPRIGLRLDVSEPSLLGDEVVGSVLFDELAPASADGAHYEAVVPLPGGGRDTFDITVTGVHQALQK